MINLKIAQLLKSCKALSQSRLALDATINRGQLNAWLKSGNNLAEERVVALIDSLLAWLDKEGLDCKAHHADLIDSIKAYPRYQATQSISFPMQPVPAGHPTYIERVLEDQMARLLEIRDADVAVVGGPKMGKTSLLNWLQRHLHNKHIVLRCDFRKPGEAVTPLRSIEQAAKTVGVEAERLRNWAAFPDWARRSLLIGAKPCTLILDHVQELTTEQLRDLQDGLHHMINQRRKEPALSKLNLVLAYDEAAPSMRATREHASGMVRELRSLVLAGFNESQVEGLLKSILQISDTTELEILAQTAGKFFRGHPFLTHLWADSLATQTGRCNPELALADISDKTDELLFRPFLSNLDVSTLNALKAATANGTIENISAPALLWLRDSGLFDINGFGAQISIEFSSDWIRARLMAALDSVPL